MSNHRPILVALALASAGAFAAAPAHADSIGWLEVFDGAPYSFTSLPAGNGLTHLGTGQYAVTFWGLGNGLNSNVQVNASIAFSTAPHYCTSGGWTSSNGTDVTAYVNCYAANGAPQDADFTVFYQSRPGAPLPGGGNEAFLWANQPSSASYTPSPFYNYNSTGGTNTVSRENVGVYFAFLPGFITNGGNPQVTAFGSSAAHCEIGDWYHNAAGTNVSVACFDGSGNPVDTMFNLVFTQKEVESSQGFVGSNGPGATPGAYVWNSNYSLVGAYTPGGPTNFDDISTKRANIGNFGGGASVVNLPYPNTVNVATGMDMASAVGSAGEYCATAGFGYGGSPQKPTLQMSVQCYDRFGDPQNVSYTATFLPSP